MEDWPSLLSRSGAGKAIAGPSETLRPARARPEEGALEPEVDTALWTMSHATDVPPTGRCWVASMIAQTDPDVPASQLDRRARETWDACGLTRIQLEPTERTFCGCIQRSTEMPQQAPRYF